MAPIEIDQKVKQSIKVGQTATINRPGSVIKGSLRCGLGQGIQGKDSNSISRVMV